MTFFGIFRLFRLFFVYALFITGGSLLIVSLTIGRIQNELRFHRLYGNDWVAQYEKYQEPLVKSNVLIGVGVAYVIGTVIFMWWLYRRMTLQQPVLYHRRRRRRD